jgi:phosphopantothenoylcysteine decarboxylase / phosphopantothenate---cysteine ligase
MTRPLEGITALVTSGPTRERIDPVRYISNDSSGKQGYAIAAALAVQGAKVTLVSGITGLPAPANVTLITVESACDMLDACLKALPVKLAICAAAVADFRPAIILPQKIKKRRNEDGIELKLIKNPDILATIAQHPNHRPELVIGFAAETENIIINAQHKLQHKQCDWILANDVSQGVFNSDDNTIEFITAEGTESWGKMSKMLVAEKLTERIVRFFG